MAKVFHQDIGQMQYTGYAQELNRTLTFKDLVVYGLVAMLPIAPTQVYGTIAQASTGMTALVYLIGILAMVFTAISYNKMSKEFPIAGSAYSYVQRGLNPHIGFVVGWMVAIDYLLVPGLLIAFSTLWLSSILPNVPAFLLIFMFAAIISFVNIRGVTMASWVNKLFLALQLILIALFLGCATVFVFKNGGGVGGFTFDPIFQSGKIDLSFIATATSIAVLGFLGFDTISTLSEETKDPTKTVGKSMVASLVLIGLMFIAQAYMASLAHPNYSDLNPEMAYFDIIREVGGDRLYYAFIIVGVISVGIANALAVQSAISRILYSMGRDKLLPFSNVLSKVHPVYKTPVNAILLTGIVSALITWVMSIDNIVKLVNFGALTAFMMINLSVIVHFYIRKKQRGFNGFLKNVVTPLIGFSIIAFIWFGLDKMTFIVGFIWMAIGILVGAIKSKGYKEVPPTIKEV